MGKITDLPRRSHDRRRSLVRPVPSVRRRPLGPPHSGASHTVAVGTHMERERCGRSTRRSGWRVKHATQCGVSGELAAPRYIFMNASGDGARSQSSCHDGGWCARARSALFSKRGARGTRPLLAPYPAVRAPDGVCRRLPIEDVSNGRVACKFEARTE